MDNDKAQDDEDTNSEGTWLPTVMNRELAGESIVNVYRVGLD